MGPMFGAPIGISAAEADIRAQQMSDLALSEGKVRLEQAQLTLSAQKQMMDLMKAQTQGASSGAPPGSPASAMSQLTGDHTDQMASNLDMMADLAMRSGLPEQAKDFAVSASTLRHNAATIQNDKMEGTIKELNLVGSLMDQVHDQASWDQANQMYQKTTGKASPYASMPYNPRVVEELRTGVMSAKDRALTAAAKAREKASEATEKEREARVPLIRAQTALAAERTTQLRKNGSVAKIPKASDIKAITDLMTKDYGLALLPEDMRVLARQPAERMLDLMRTQNIPQSQAAVKAYQEAKAAGDFGGIRPRVQMSGSFKKPLDLPESKDKLRPNMYYKGKPGGAYEGKTLLWTGAAFVPVGSEPGMIQPDEADEDDQTNSEDDTDEESENPDDNLPAREP